MQKWYLFCRDNYGEQCFYEPVAVIEYIGNFNHLGQSSGHYICDVKKFPTKQWYRTNDSTDPVRIDLEDVSRYGYIILYSRT